MFTALLSAALLSPVAPVPKDFVKAPDYFPTAVGTKRVYERETKDTFAEEVVAAEAADGGLRLTVRRSFGPGNSMDDTLQVMAARMTRLTTGHFELNEQLLRLPLKEGDEWTFDTPVQRGLLAESGTTTVGKAEKVTVPAGTFEAVPVRMTVTAANGQKLPPPRAYTRWYATGVGMVKIEYEGGFQALKEFTSGRGKKKEPEAEKK